MCQVRALQVRALEVELSFSRRRGYHSAPETAWSGFESNRFGNVESIR
jgi:hypothetical protein